VLKELLLIGKDKELSFGERRLLEQSMGLITLELAHALDTTQEDVKARIEVFFEDVLHPEENPE
jgi:CarD family transcriptional regulator